MVTVYCYVGIKYSYTKILLNTTICHRSTDNLVIILVRFIVIFVMTLQQLCPLSSKSSWEDMHRGARAPIMAETEITSSQGCRPLILFIIGYYNGYQAYY